MSEEGRLFWDTLRRSGQCFTCLEDGVVNCGEVVGEPTPGFFMVDISPWKDRTARKRKLVSPEGMAEWEFFPSKEEREKHLQLQETFEAVRKERRGES